MRVKKDNKVSEIVKAYASPYSKYELILEFADKHKESVMLETEHDVQYTIDALAQYGYCNINGI